MTLSSGKTVGPYKILAPLGAGGMGEVYRATDGRLDREVAVKVLPDQFAADPAALSRFEREAKAVAALSHPNVLAVYDVGREGDIPYVVTELLEGQTLRERLKEGPLPWRKAVDIGKAVVDGLAAAHARGIVHRDLKPENIFITSDGVVKILDFGLARMDQAKGGGVQDAAHTPTVTIETRPGTVIGTLNYMSPEQLRGLATDARSDIFAFGCVLYEMVTGRRAFRGETSADTMTAILRETPTSVRTETTDVGVELERVIERCLEKRPEERFHSASDLGFTLKTILADSGPQSTEKDTGRLWGFAIPVAAAAVVLLAMGVWLLVQIWSKTPRTEPAIGEIRSIAVLPFDNLSTDDTRQMYVDAIWESITDDLAKIGALQVTSSHTLRYYREQNMPMSEIEGKLEVDAFITGSALHSGERVEVRVRLIRAADGRQLWSNYYDFDKRDILTEQRKVARAVAKEIQVELSPAEEKMLAPAPRIVPTAYDAYVHGMEKVHLATRESLHEALALFNQSLAEDPDFALAYVGRARAYYRMAGEFVAPREAMPACRKAALQALAIDPSLAEAYTVIGLYKLQYEWDWDGARDAFKEALELSPSLAKAHLGYALYLSAMDRGQEALRQLDTVQELDRASLYTDFDHNAVSYMARDYARTIRDGEAAVAIDPDWWGAHSWLAMAYSIRGEYDNAIKHARQVQYLNPTPNNRAMIGGILAVAGHREEAEEIYEDLKRVEPQEYVCPYELASIPLGLGDVDTTFYEMNRACEKRADCLAWLQVDPRLDPIRDDPRFDDLLVRVGFEPKHRGLRMIDETTHTVAQTNGNRIMLAVLPLENLSNDEDQEYFSDGMTEEMILHLGRLRPEVLGVIARTSAMHYKNAEKTVDQIGRELGVAYIVEGGVRRAGDTVRINAQLIQVSDQTQLWGDSYTRQLSDVFAIQSEVAEAVAQALAVELLSQTDTAPANPPTASEAAHDEYLLGRHYWAKRTPEALYTAIDHFQRAVDRDPDYALAYCGLADAWAVLHWYLPGPYDEMNAKARQSAEKALALDQSLAEAHLSMANVLAESGDLASAGPYFRKAISLDPNNATAHQWYGLLLSLEGRHDAAKKEFERAITLDPLSAVMRDDYGGGMLFARRFDEAIIQCKRALELQPKFLTAAGSLMWAYIGKGDYAAAAATFQERLRLIDQPAAAIRKFRRTYETSGLRAGLVAWLESIEDERPVPGFGPGVRAAIYAWCNQEDSAFKWLDRAVEQQDPQLLLVESHFAFDGLRDDPRYPELLRRLPSGGDHSEIRPR